ncbi:MAG: phage portal protein [Dehalococcoidales bacterium]|nr:phage portal protein [Dehalococcoidales bacterium]
MKFTDRVRLLFRNDLSEYIRQFLSGEDMHYTITQGEPVTSSVAMKYTAVFACIRVLGETAANVPMLLYRKKDNGEREPRNDLSVYDIFHDKPNDEMSPFNFKEACMASLNLGGNSVCERLVNRKGELVGLYPYQWQQVRIDRHPDTARLRYTIIGDPSNRELTREEVFHIPGLSLDGVIGLSPIEYASSAIQLGRSYEQFGVNLYKNGANPSGALSAPGTLKDEAFLRLKKQIKEEWTGLKNTGVPLLLEGGTEFKQFTIKPADAQLIENKRFQLEDIARIYRVPMHLIQDLSRSTNNNIEHQSLEFVMYTMLPWFKRWEENIKTQLLTPAERKAGFYIEFKVDGLLRGDAASRASAYAKGRQWGWLSVNDIRRLENMPPIPNGNIYLQPSNMVEAGGQIEDQTKALAEEIYKMVSEGRAVA